ncbi:hypothetical protein PG990_012077 [Apiospora arundinis]
METHNQPLRPLRPGGNTEPTSSSTTSIINLSTKRQTCLQCRIRKVRCDGRPTTCTNCQRLGFECSFRQTAVGNAPSVSSAAPHGATAGHLRLPERRRRTQACVHCRSRKTRCQGGSPECSNCIKKGIVCKYPTPSSKRQKHIAADDTAASSASPGSSHTSRGTSLSPAAAPASQHDLSSGTADGVGDNDVLDPTSGDPSSSLTASALDQTTLNALVEDYFEHLYPLPSYAFLHKATVLQRCQDETIDAPLKLAICAITSLLLQRVSYCHDLWAQQAERLLLASPTLYRPSVFRLQALLLVIRYRIESGDFPAAFMLASLAARAAVALRLNYERSDAELSPLAQEARRRLFWSLFILDDFFSVGLREFELCPREIVHLQVPSDDDAFREGRSCRTGPLDQSLSAMKDNSGGIGLRGAFLRLVSIRREVMRHIRRVALEELSAAGTTRSIRTFEQQLDALRASLRAEEQYSAANLRKSRLKAQFVMVHASWHQCYCDLYRIYLPSGYTEAALASAVEGVHPVKRGVMQRSCQEHAENILKIVADFWNLRNDVDSDCAGGKNTPGQPLLIERDVAVCAFESARIVLFCCASASPANDALVDVALSKARLCLDVIKHHFAWSASLKTLRLKLERIIKSYSTGLALRHKETLNEPDPPEPQPTSRLSAFAKSRQRLSVQSLLLQSDFVDDSDEIAASSAGSNPPGATATATTASATTQATTVTSPPNPPISFSTLENTASTTNTTLEVPAFSAPITSAPRQQSQPLSDFGANHIDYLTINLDSNNSLSPGLSQGSGSDFTDDGSVFNPWMGFPHSGMEISWSIDGEDY